MKLFEPQVLIIILVLVLLLAIPYWFSWRILGKAGYNQWLSLIAFIPYGVFVIGAILAFGDWPSQRLQGVGPASAAVPIPVAPAGWLSDPSSRHEFRYWDGSRWTPNVMTGGVQSSDPLWSSGPPI